MVSVTSALHLPLETELELPELPQYLSQPFFLCHELIPFGNIPGVLFHVYFGSFRRIRTSDAEFFNQSMLNVFTKCIEEVTIDNARQVIYDALCS